MSNAAYSARIHVQKPVNHNL